MKNIFILLTLQIIIFIPTSIQSKENLDEFRKSFEVLKTSIISEDKYKRDMAVKAILEVRNPLEKSLNTMFEKTIKELKKKIPQTLDSTTRIDGIVERNDGFSYFYTVSIDFSSLTLKKKNEFLKALRKETHEIAINQICTKPFSAMFLVFGNTIARHYNLENGESIFHFIVSWKDCDSR